MLTDKELEQVLPAETSAFDTRVKEGLKLQPSDAIIGIIYIGTAGIAPRETPRPELGDFVSYWRG